MTEAADDTEDHMVKIDKLICDMQAIKDRFGNTCVYIRRGGLSWGAVALNRRDDDRKHGVFDLQAQHDRDMLARLEQIERLKASRDRAEAEMRRLHTALTEIAETPYSMANDSESLRFSLRAIISAAEKALKAPAITGNNGEMDSAK